MNQWNKQARDMLIGRKIVKVEWMTSQEAEDCGWSGRPICILLDNGIWIYPSRDDEGNDAGSLFSSNEEIPVLPVISLNFEEQTNA
jgi:hypothetical protein